MQHNRRGCLNTSAVIIIGASENVSLIQHDSAEFLGGCSSFGSALLGKSLDVAKNSPAVVTTELSVHTLHGGIAELLRLLDAVLVGLLVLVVVCMVL